MVDVEIRGAAELIIKLNRAAGLLSTTLVSTMKDANEIVSKEASIYPSTTEANSPPTPYYVRGMGTQTSDAVNRMESEQLDKHWQSTVEVGAGEVIGRTTNPVTYAPWVHGKTKQVFFHGIRGWRWSGAILDAVSDRIVSLFGKAVASVVRR